MDPNNPFEVALKRSVELSKIHEERSALRILDESIALAIDEKQVPWIVTLSSHAAIMSRFIRDLQRAE